MHANFQEGTVCVSRTLYGVVPAGGPPPPPALAMPPPFPAAFPAPAPAPTYAVCIEQLQRGATASRTNF